jgi:hypothetical protein
MGSAQAPDIPTFAEVGLSVLTYFEWTPKLFFTCRRFTNRWLPIEAATIFARNEQDVPMQRPAGWCDGKDVSARGEPVRQLA